MNYKYVLLPAIFLCSLLTSFSQITSVDDLDFDHDEVFCKFHKTGFKQDHQKSVVNPNPLVFQYDVKFYKLDIEAYDTTNQFKGNAIVLTEVTVEVLDTFSIELSNKLQADSVLINGELYAYDHSGHDISVVLASPVIKGDLLEFKLYYHTPPGYTSNYYSATLASSYGNFNVSQSFSEPYFAHEWMPCKQELEDKADSVHIFITTDDDLKVAGPGLLTEVLLPDNKVRHEWRTSIPTAFYLIAFAISDYQEYNIYAKPDSLPGDSILIMNYVYDYPNCLESNKTTIDYTPDMLELLSNKFGIYPFHEEKYGHYMWQPSSFSGMEHITMTGMRYFNFNLVAHELGHSWFGDNVTCATWSDIWVNEGFATYAEYLTRQYMISQASANSLMVSYQNYAMTSPGGSVYVPENELTNWGRIFSTRLTYRKGGSLVHMIRFEMNNDSLFFRTLNRYQQKFKDSLATGIDFRNVCQEVSGIDFTHFFEQWYFGEGYPIYNLSWWQKADTVFLLSKQETSTTVTPLFKMPLEYKLSYAGNDTVIRVYHLTNDTLFKVVLANEITGVEIDPNNWVLEKVEEISHRNYLNVTVLLEGPYNSQTQNMDAWLNPGLLPIEQPYYGKSWNYNGTESVAAIPNENIVDWLLISIYDTTNANLVSSDALINRQAGFLLNDGSMVGLDGFEKPYFNHSIDFGLYLKIEHRNHLSILSAEALQPDKSFYSINFTESELHVYGGANGYKQIAPGIWGMASGDVNGNGEVELTDISDQWQSNAGNHGYHAADLNLNGELNNTDKDECWLPNYGKSSSVGQFQEQDK
jgi:hypothetical protein